MAGPSPGLQTQVLLSGPLFTEPDRILRNSITRHNLTLAKGTQRRIKERLDKVLVNPTGFYRAHIQITAVAGEFAEVTDSGVIYGPWLEGIGSRNSLQGFRGYATFRRAKQGIDRWAREKARREANRLARDLER